MNLLRLGSVRALARFFFSGRVVLLFLAGFFVGSICVSPKASASSAEITDFQDQISDKRKEITEAKKELKTVNQELARLGDCQDLGDDPDFGGSCDCTTSSSCTDTDFKLAGVDRTQTDSQSCYTLYQAKNGLTAGFSYSCLSLIDRCGTVACLKRKKSDTARRTELDGPDGTIKSDESDLKDLQTQLEAAKKQCPNCGVASAQQQQRDPTTGELIIGGIQAVTPLIGMGLGTYANLQGMNRYYSSYNNSLQQCATIGVPCQAPAVYGLNNGLAYRNYSGLGLAGGIVGLGGIVSGGVGLGSYLGLGYGYGGGGAAILGVSGLVGAGLGYGGGGGGAILGVGGIVGGGLGYGGYNTGYTGYSSLSPYGGYTVPYSGLAGPGGGIIGVGGILGNTSSGYALGGGYALVGGIAGLGLGGLSSPSPSYGIGYGAYPNYFSGYNNSSYYPSYGYPNSFQSSAGTNSVMIAQQQAYEAQVRAYQMQSSASAYGYGTGGYYNGAGGIIGGNGSYGYGYGMMGGILGNSYSNNNGYGTYSGYGSNSGSRSF